MKGKTYYILGDIHGEFSLMIDILLKAGLISKYFKWDAPEGTVLVQVGDMVDGAPSQKSISSYLLLKDLQKEAVAANNKSAVIRLAGNHELHYIGACRGGGYSKEISDALSHTIKIDCLNKSLQAAYCMDGWLITHAGRCHGHMTNGEANKTIATWYNDQLFKAAVSDNFNSPIFRVGKSRGGYHDTGGIFWADYWKDVVPFGVDKQIVGHTSVEISSDFSNIINVDTGFSRHVPLGVPSILKYCDGIFEFITLN